MKKNKETQIGGLHLEEKLLCFFCKQLTSEEETIKTKSNKLCCETCYDPNDLEQQSEELSEVAENTQKTTLKTFLNTFSESEKDKQKAVELSSEEIEKLNNQVGIPRELNIIDCPPDVNSNPEWFRIQFKNF